MLVICQMVANIFDNVMIVLLTPDSKKYHVHHNEKPMEFGSLTKEKQWSCPSLNYTV